jgi:hypothetical protein
MTTILALDNPIVPVTIECPVGDLPIGQSIGAGEWGIDTLGSVYFDPYGAPANQAAIIALDGSGNPFVVSSHDPTAPQLMQITMPVTVTVGREAREMAREARAVALASPTIADPALAAQAREMREAALHPDVKLDVGVSDAAREKRHQAIETPTVTDQVVWERARAGRYDIGPAAHSGRLETLKEAQLQRAEGRLANLVPAPHRTVPVVGKRGSVPAIPTSPKPRDSARLAEAQAERAAARSSQRVPMVGQTGGR